MCPLQRVHSSLLWPCGGLLWTFEAPPSESFSSSSPCSAAYSTSLDLFSPVPLKPLSLYLSHINRKITTFSHFCEWSKKYFQLSRRQQLWLSEAQAEKCAMKKCYVVIRPKNLFKTEVRVDGCVNNTLRLWHKKTLIAFPTSGQYFFPNHYQVVILSAMMTESCF